MRRKHARNALRCHADDRIRQLLRQFQLVQGHDDGNVFLVRQRLQNAHQLGLAFYIQKRRWFVQQQNFRLLADSPGQQHTLTLAVADFGKIPVGKGFGLHQSQGFVHGTAIGIGQNTQPPGVGVAPGGGHIKAGRQFGACRVGQHQRQLARTGVGGVGRQRLAVQQHRAALRRQLPGQRF